MTKAELIDDVKASVEKTTGQQVSKKIIKETVDAILTSINDCMANGDEILLQPIGRFGVKFRNKRSAKNMITGEPLVIAAKYVPNFSATSSLKESVAKLEPKK
jgi:DNA-binding protein HU-beta